MESLKGRPYIWGAAGPDAFDCSGFVHYVLSSEVGPQHYRGKEIRSTTYRAMLIQAGARIPESEAQPGDIVFFPADATGIAHIGIVTKPKIGFFVTAQGKGLGVMDGSYAKGQYWHSHKPEIYRNIWMR